MLGTNGGKNAANNAAESTVVDSAGDYVEVVHSLPAL